MVNLSLIIQMTMELTWNNLLSLWLVPRLIVQFEGTLFSTKLHMPQSSKTSGPVYSFQVVLMEQTEINYLKWSCDQIPKTRETVQVLIGKLRWM